MSRSMSVRHRCFSLDRTSGLGSSVAAAPPLTGPSSVSLASSFSSSSDQRIPKEDGDDVEEDDDVVVVDEESVLTCLEEIRR